MNEHLGVTEEDIQRYANGNVKRKAYLKILLGVLSILGVVCIVMFFVGRATGMSEQEKHAWYVDIMTNHKISLFMLAVLTIKYAFWLVQNFKKGKTLMRETKELSDHLLAVTGEVHLTEKGGGRDYRYYFELKVQNAYCFREGHQEFIACNELGVDNLRFVLPIKKCGNVNLYSDVVCIYGSKSNTLYEVRVIESISERTYALDSYKKVENFDEMATLPSLYFDLQQECLNKKNTNVMYGVIAYAKASGDARNNNVHWMIDITVTDIHGIESGHDYDRSKAHNFGQTLKDKNTECDVYEFKKTLEYQMFFDGSNKYKIGDQVIAITGYKDLKLRKLYLV